MKRTVEIVKVIKKTAAVSMAATTAVGTVGNLPQLVSNADSNSMFEISDNPYMCRLRKSYNGFEFDLTFLEYKDDKKIFTKQDGLKLIESGKIQINDGKEWTVKDASLNFDNDRTESSFNTKNINFIKEFYTADELRVKVTTADGTVVEGIVSNKLTQEEKDEFKKSLSGVEKISTETVTPSNNNDSSSESNDVPTSNTNPDSHSSIDNSSTESNSTLKIDKMSTHIEYKSWSDPGLDISISGSGEGMQANAIIKDEDSFVNSTEIKINGKSYGTMKNLGFLGKKWPGANTFRTEDFSKIKDLLDTDVLHIELVTKDYGTLRFDVENKLSKEQIKKIKETSKESITSDSENSSDTGNANEETVSSEGNIETVSGNGDNTGTEGSSNTTDTTNNDLEKPSTENKNISETKMYSADVMLMHSANGDHNYIYTQQSMSGPVLIDKAEIIETGNSRKLVMHFKVAIIMGATAYATGLKLVSQDFGILGNDIEGDIHTEFKLFADNSGICIVDLPKIDNPVKGRVFEGHIYSNIMDNTVAMKVSNIKSGGDIEKSLDELIKESESKLQGKEFYKEGKDKFEKALTDAKTHKNIGESYVNLVKASADLREKLENPFVDGDLFFVPVQATSTYASPTTGKKLLNPWAKVTKVGNKARIELDYTTFADYTGNIGLKNIKIFGKDGKTEIPVTVTRNADNTAKAVFETDYYPDGGVFRTVILGLDNKEHESDLILDYAHIHKGMLPELITDAIDEVDKYQTSWTGPYDGSIMNDRAEYYTEESFKNYVDTIKKVKEDLKAENRVNLTQDIIERDVKLLKEAKDNLIYKAMESKGKVVNIGINGLSNPGNVYNDSTPHIIEAPWAGSRVKFAGHVYRVLNTGNRYDYNSGEIKETGNLMIMADDSLLLPWSKVEINDYSTKNIPRWDKSEVRRYLNEDYYNLFGDLEKSAITESEISTKDGVGNYTELGVDRESDIIKTKDKVFILDINEVKSSDFGFINPGARKHNNYYFLRNMSKPSYHDEKFKLTGVKPKGNIETLNQHFTDPTNVYPVINLDKSKILMTLQSGLDISNGLEPVNSTGKNVWDIVLKNGGLDLSVSNIEANKNNISFNYTSTNSQGKSMIAAIVSGGDFATGSIKAIGKVGEVSESGNVEFKVPDFDNTKDKLYVFAMDESGDTMSAGNPVLVDTSKLKIDKNQLFTKLREARRKVVNIYTDETKNKLIAEINKAELVYNNDDASKTEVDSSVANLNESINGLVKKSTPVVTPIVPKYKSYTAPVEMIKYYPENYMPSEKEYSMSNNAVDHIAKVSEKDGKIKIKMLFKPMTVQSLKGHLINMSVGGKPVEIVDRYEDGHIKTISFEVDKKSKYIKGRVEVDVMNMLAGNKSAPQDVYIAIDWDKEINVEEVVDNVDNNSGKNNTEALVNEEINKSGEKPIVGDVIKAVFEKDGDIELEIKDANDISTEGSATLGNSAGTETTLGSATSGNSAGTGSTESSTTSGNSEATGSTPGKTTANESKQNDEDSVNKIVVQLPKKKNSRSRRSRSLDSLNNASVDTITFVKNSGVWKVIDSDKDKITEFKITNTNKGILSIKFKLTDEIKQKVNMSAIKVVTLNKDENELHAKDIVSKESIKKNNSSLTNNNGTTTNPSTSKSTSNSTSNSKDTTSAQADSNKSATNPLENNVNLEDGKNLNKAGKYTSYDVLVDLKKLGTNEDSMAKNSVDKYAHIVEKDGVSEVTLSFKPIKLMGLEGHLLKMSIGGKDVNVVEKDSQGRPTKISFVVKGHPAKITAEVEVDAMNELNGGKSAPQKLDIVLDWDHRENVKEENGQEVISSETVRIAGSNRIETSIEISKKYFKEAKNAILVNSTKYADALVSANYAKLKNAPILLADKDSVSSSVLNEMKRLGVKEVTIIGGESSISDKVLDELKSSGINVERIAGANRYETSQKLAEIILSNTKASKIALVNGDKSADALAISSLSNKENMPVVMIRNSEADKDLKDKLVSWGIKEVVAVGGENSISKIVFENIFSGLKSRVSGDNRYMTALEIAKKSYPNPKKVFISNGVTMIDALSVGAVTYKEQAPILLVEKDSMKNQIRSFIEKVKNKVIVGGKNTIE